MHISSFTPSRGTSCLLKLCLPWATKVQFPFSLFLACQKGIILCSADRACTIFHILFPFTEISHTVNVFLLTWDTGSKIGGIKTDNSMCAHCWSWKKLLQTVLLFPAYYARSRHTTPMSTVWILCINRFSVKHTFKNINLLRLCMHSVNHFTNSNPAEFDSKSVIFTTILRGIQLTWTKWYQLELKPVEEREVLTWFQWIWHTFLLTWTERCPHGNPSLKRSEETQHIS